MKKTIFSASAAALVLASAISTPAFADTGETPSIANAAAMATACNALAANLGPTTAGDYTWYEATPVYDGNDGDVVENLGAVRTYSNWQPDTASTVTYHDFDASQSTHLVRNGKSPNIFATDIRAGSMTWSNNSADYTADGTVTTTFTFQCHVVEHTWTPPVPGTYHYIHSGPSQSVAQDDCSRFDDQYTDSNYGLPWGNCSPTVVTAPQAGGHEDNDGGEQGAFDSLTQSRAATFEGNNANAGSHTYYDDVPPVAGVVCISPGSKGGAWKTQNLYAGLGGACSTATFNSLAPNTIIPSASLPVI